MRLSAFITVRKAILEIPNDLVREDGIARITP